MQMTGRSYSSGEWLVRPGSEQEFIERWTSFIEWTSNEAPGALSFVLVRSTGEPTTFLSLGAWESQTAQEVWREMTQMQVMLGHCRALCDEYDTYRYTLAARLGR
jgi:heme-degrading monooxygenase HmoA